MSPEFYFNAAIAIVSSLITASAAWGIMKTRVDRLESDFAKMDERFVTKEYFEAAFEPVQEAIKEIRADIKQILMLMSHSEPKTRKPSN